ncbi:unnamed protein product [Echinostoma caproni]|uniref:Peptidase A2 domain-containing protein n=1 Tax=Echinostoma caproni TaxID=27848 RepID=A0A183B5C1_9TREM|nr:unnamed protein product [Echinostoma caproni]
MLGQGRLTKGIVVLAKDPIRGVRHVVVLGNTPGGGLRSDMDTGAAITIVDIGMMIAADTDLAVTVDIESVTIDLRPPLPVVAIVLEDNMHPLWSAPIQHKKRGAPALTTTSVAVTTTSAVGSTLRLNTQELLNQIQKHQEAQAKAQAVAAAAAANLPKYYNPSSVNVLKLAEQQQKRKLLWSKKSDDGTSSVSVRSLRTLWILQSNSV